MRQLNRDIHYIKTGPTRQHAIGDFFFGSTAYWVTLAVLFLGFVSLFIIFRKRAIERADVVKQRAGRANKVATKRLKKAARLLKDGKQGEFYDEVLRALWGYVGDKLNMPVEQLSRENISHITFLKRPSTCLSVLLMSASLPAMLLAMRREI